MKIHSFGNRFDVLCGLLLVICSLLVYTPYNHIGLWFIIPMIFGYYVINFFYSFKLESDSIPYLLILFLSFLSCFISNDIKLSFDSFSYMLTGFVGFYLFKKCSGSINNISLLFAVYFVYYVAMWWYIYTNLGIGGIDITTERLGTEKGQLNANDVAYMTFYFNTAIWMLYVLSPKVYRSKFVGLALIIFMFLVSFISATLFASRQILILELPFMFGLFYLRFLRENRGLGKLFLFVSFVLIFVLFYQYINKSVLSDSLLFTRYENMEDDSRIFLMQKAIEVGSNHPILGVGCGNFMNYAGLSVFSHCSYTELFANSGLLAAIIYVVWVIRILFIQIKRYRITKDLNFLYLALICSIWFFSNFFYVYYLGIWLMGFWGLLIGASKTFYQQEVMRIRYE